MIEDPNLIFFGYLLWLGSLLLILGAVGSEAFKGKSMPHDRWLRDRMTQLDIPSWKALAEKSGLNPLRLRQIRRGSLAEVKVAELAQLARALQWTVAQLEQKLGILSTSVPVSPPPEEGVAEQLRQECRRVRSQLQEQKAEVARDVRDATFEQLQSLLANYPTVRQLVEAKPDLPAKNLTGLFAPLDNLLESWGCDRIGAVWEAVEYDPQLHQADAEDIQPGDRVYVRFVGYRIGDRILCPAKVSRTLPANVTRDT